MSDVLSLRRKCPCGCGRYLPESIFDLHVGAAGRAIEQWAVDQGLTMDQVRAHDNHPEMVEARRRIAKFLIEHGWSVRRVGLYLERDRSTVRALMGGRRAG